MDHNNDKYSLNGRSFGMVSSTSSVVDQAAPTVFNYWEDNGLIWGDFDGDTVRQGRLTGLRSGDTFTLRFILENKAGGFTQGEAVTKISFDESGKMILTEDFKSADGAPQQSICRELE